jgi:GH35 family endo-1,4-beta-xylanase
LDKIIAEKKRMLKESGLSISSTTSTTSNYAYVNLTQYPQQGIIFWGQIISHSWIYRLEEDFNKTFQHAVLVILTLLKKIITANIHIRRFVI